MSQQHAAWEVRLDRDGHVLPQVPVDQVPDDGGGRYLVVPSHDGSLEVLALEVFAKRQQESASHPADGEAELTATDPSRYSRRALGDLSAEAPAIIALPDHASQLTLIDPRQPDRPQPQAIRSSSPEAVQSALSGSVSEWTYWLTQNRDARVLYQQKSQQPTPGANPATSRSASGRARASSARCTPSGRLPSS